jgi:protein TorT
MNRNRLRRITISILLVAGSCAAQEWPTIEVQVWNPPFDDQLQRQSEVYTALPKASRVWKVCASLPHLKDAYWLAVNFSLVDEAKRLGVSLRIDEAGGYGKLSVQRVQIQECMETGADGLIVSGVTTPGVTDLVETYIAQGKPVVDLINWISPEGLTARAAVSYWDNGHMTGEYLKQIVKGQPTKVLWFPGPRGPGWPAAGDRGFRDALQGGTIQILDAYWGDTGRATQARLLEDALDSHPDADYVVGTTVTAEAAVELLRSRGLQEEIKVIAYYFGPGVYRGIKRGQILAVPTDNQGL